MLILCVACTQKVDYSEQAHVERLEQYRNDKCAANILFHEARGESLLGQRAVYDVVMNRAAKGNRSVCEVMSERNAFSWNIQNSKHTKALRPMTQELHNLLQSVKNSDNVLSEKYLYFFGKHIKPKWSRKMSCSIVDSHLFCKEKA